MPAISTVTDDFNDNTIALPRWVGNYGVVSEVGGRARVECSTGFSGYATAWAYSLDVMYVRMYPPELNAATSEAMAGFWFANSTTPGTDLGFFVNRVTGKLWCAHRTGYFDAGATIIDYDPVAHAWLRLSQAGGNVVWETSSTGLTWTVRRTLAAPAWAAAETAGRALLESHRNDGTPDYAEFDNFNTSPLVLPGVAITAQRLSGTLDLLDLSEHIGQVGCSYRFDVVDGVTGVTRGQVHPLQDTTPSLDHDSTSTISRKIQNLTLGAEEAVWFRPLSDRIAVTMVLGDRDRTEFPLGRYMVADDSRVAYSQGDVTPLTLYDEMFIVDQELEAGFNANGEPADVAIRRLLEYVPLGIILLEGNTGERVYQSWGAGTGRGSAVTDLATAGGYFQPWFDHLNRLRFVQAFEPGDRQPDLDLDWPPRVFRDSISFQSDLVTAPNRWIVRSNSTGMVLGDEGAEQVTLPPVFAVYDVPSSAPYSITQRGFALPRTVEAQVRTKTAAAIYARTLGVQRTIYERCTLSTPPDPRHDGYNVVRFQGENWLEIGWSMPLVSGGAMSHTLRRAYPSTGEDDLE